VHERTGSGVEGVAFAAGEGVGVGVLGRGERVEVRGQKLGLAVGVPSVVLGTGSFIAFGDCAVGGEEGDGAVEGVVGAV
jgi:hypothetical protein